jgi:para-nitrobenzyl esterase
MGYVAAFAKTGDPNSSGLTSWPRYDPAKSELMMFTSDATGAMQADPWKSRIDLIERAVEKQGAPPQ